jgi:hypothetical protein
VKTETLARKLGTTAHVSPLLMKARRLGLRGVEDLEKLAFERGCFYYDPRGSAKQRDDALAKASTLRNGSARAEDSLSNEELATALISICLPEDQMRLRVGAAMLAARGNSPVRLARLARQERCEMVMGYIAECGKHVEPGNSFWTELIALLPEAQAPGPWLLPHITRFVAMTGLTRRGRETIMQWIRPATGAAA